MPRSINAIVTPSVLEWARKKAGYDIPGAAKKIGRSEEEISQWESGDLLPTLAQAKKAAEVYRRSLAVFFLPEPPKEFQTLRDFRHLPGNRSHDFSPQLSRIIQEIEYRQSWLRDWLIEEKEAPLEFIGSVSTSARAPDIAEMIRSHLGITTDDQLSCSTRDDALNLWIDRAEKIGINICREGGIKVDEARGLVLTDEYAPFIMLNNEDSKAGRLFTLAHELAHLWINAPGISNMSGLGKEGVSEEDRIEVYCNRVASFSLLDSAAFARLWAEQASEDPVEEKIRIISNLAKVSEEVIARRLLDSDQISVSDYHEFRKKFFLRWKEFKDKEKAKNRSKDKPGGPSPHLLRVQRNGKSFTQTVLSAYFNGMISGADASQLLHAKVNNFGKVASKAGLSLLSTSSVESM